MSKNNNNGVNMLSLVITIAVIIIIAAVSIFGSTRMIDDANRARNDANASAENDLIRNIMMQSIVDEDQRVGIPLSSSMVILGSGDKEYGTGFYLIPGGTDFDLNAISEKTGKTESRYNNITAAYVVDYDNGDFERLSEVRFK